MKISTSKYDIVETGSVIIPSNDYVQFSFENLRFRFFFASSEFSDRNESEVVGTIKDDNEGKYLEIKVNNFKGMFASPMHMLTLGKIQEKNLYVDFSIVSLTSDSDRIGERIMLYSWYKDK